MPRYNIYIEQDVKIHVLTAKAAFTVEAAGRAAVEAIIDRIHAAVGGDSKHNDIETAFYPLEAIDPVRMGKIALSYEDFDDRGAIGITYQRAGAAILTLADYRTDRCPNPRLP